MRRAMALVALGVLGFGAAASCSGGRARAGQADLVVNGQALLTRSGGRAVPAPHEVRLAAGDQVKMLNGTAVAKLSRGGTLELREGTSLLMGATPALQTGDLLVEPKSARQAITVASTQGQVIARGPARVTEGLALTAGSYGGGLDLATAGARPSPVAPLRQASVAVRGVAAGVPVPLTYQAADPWDRKYLSQAMAWDRELDAVSQGVTANSTGAVDATLVRRLYPDLRLEGDLDGLVAQVSRLPAGELLVGTGISVQGRRGSLPARWASVFGFRGQGANWGLVALDQGITPDGSLATLLAAATGRVQYPFAQVAAGTAPLLGPVDVARGPGAAAPSGVATTSPTSTPPGSTGPTPGPSPAPAPAPNPPPTIPPTTIPGPVPIPSPIPLTVPTIPPVDTGTPVDSIVNPLIGTVNKLLH